MDVTFEFSKVDVTFEFSQRWMSPLNFPGEASEDTKADFDASAITQIAADFSFPEHGDPMITFSFERCDEPAPIPNWGSFVFARKGVWFQQSTPAGG